MRAPQRLLSNLHRGIFWLAVLATAAVRVSAEELVTDNALGLRLPPHFRATLFAGPEMAPDIYAMTLDSKGRVVVTGPDYIKRLEDTKRAGRADKAVLFAKTRSGGMGLCFNGNNLVFFGDGALSLYPATNNTETAEGPPLKIASFGFGEHGAHAIRQGPDGYWYLIGGNDSGFGRGGALGTNDTGRPPEAGALLRFSPNGLIREVVAQGFRNPYDFDFNLLGDVFTYDSDIESDYFLPWYTPTRLFHVAAGGHHGWRLDGYKRGWNRPSYSPDTTEILLEVGRGSPTGVACYRHYQLPEHYWNGLFACDWTFGRIYFFSLEFQGGEYASHGEVFLEPSGTQGFAPTDIVVAPDGSLYVSTGGRRTRGSVYHIEYTGPRPLHAPAAFTTPLESVLKAPQPLDAWSRARWMPAARKLGPTPFLKVVPNDGYSIEQKVRAIEVLTEMFGGLGPAAGEIALRWQPIVRARTAWSLGRAPAPNAEAILLVLAADPEPYVVRSALEAIADHQTQIHADRLPPVLQAPLENPDKRVRQIAARVAARLPLREWQKLWQERKKLSNQGRVTLAMAAVWRGADAAIHPESVLLALPALEDPGSAALRLDAVRVIILALGDYNLHHPSIEAYTGYELPAPLNGMESVVARTLAAVHGIFPSDNPALNIEASRLMAMLHDPDPGIPAKVLRLATPQSSATADFHALTVLPRLAPSLDQKNLASVCAIMLGLNGKLGEKQARIKQNWTQRLVEVAGEWTRRYPAFQDRLLENPEFPTAAHLSLVEVLDAPHRQRAAELLWQAARRDKNFAWSPALLDLFGVIPVAELQSALRQQWDNVPLRDDILTRLSQKPQAADREKLLAGLESEKTPVALACAGALRALPRDPAPLAVAACIRALEHLPRTPSLKGARSNMLALVEWETGQQFRIEEVGTNAAAIKAAYAPVAGWFTNTFPRLARRIDLDEEEAPESFAGTLKKVQPESGDEGRGKTLFQNRRCESCHAGEDAIGPNLTGAAQRMSMEDLFTAIVFPSKDIAPAYVPEVFQTRDNQTISGFVAFESANGVILRTGPGQTIRLATEEFISRQPGKISLMPAGLLQGLKPGDWADLYAYLRSLSPGPKR